MNAIAEVPRIQPLHAPAASALFKPSVPAAAAATFQQLIDDLPEQIALLDLEGTIVAVNHAWHKACVDHGYSNIAPGYNYRDFCAAKAAEGYEPAIVALAALDEIVSGKRNAWQLDYNGRERWSGRDYRISLHRIAVGDQQLISVTRFDLTELFELRRIKDDFTHSLIEGQMVERQRMARELHDSTSQLLTGIGLLLARLKQDPATRDSSSLVEEMQELVRETQREVRSVSYVAHSPALDVGLEDALRSLVAGFGDRTGLRTRFDIEGGRASLSPEEEHALYRVAQEALSNVYRHARAGTVHVYLSPRGSATHLVVADDGIGISAETLAGRRTIGVGLSGMHSRLAQIGGRLTVRRLAPGTAVIASLPSAR
jgi:signal transduction histidine kinase